MSKAHNCKNCNTDHLLQWKRYSHLGEVWIHCDGCGQTGPVKTSMIVAVNGWNDQQRLVDADQGQNMTTAKPFPHWNENINPPDAFLSSVFKRGDYEIIGARFLVVCNEKVVVDTFQKDSSGEFTGYWWSGEVAQKWMQLPPTT